MKLNYNKQKILMAEHNWKGNESHSRYPMLVFRNLESIISQLVSTLRPQLPEPNMYGPPYGHHAPSVR